MRFVRNRYAIPDVAAGVRSVNPGFLRCSSNPPLPAILLDAILAGRTGFPQASVTEGAKEVIEEKLRLAFFVAADVFATPGDEAGERDGKVKGQGGRSLLCVK